MKALPRKLMVVVGASLLLANCAQTGPPLPPSLELPKPPTDLRASRKGNAVTLAWSEPIRTTDRQSVRYLGPTHVCRTVEAEINECGNPVSVLSTPPAPTTASKSGEPKPQTYTDTLPEAIQKQSPAGEISYAVEVLNRDGRSAGLSNRVRVPAVPTLPPPSDLAVQLAGDGVILSWTSAAETQDLPGVRHRYRIYRRDEATAKDAIAGEMPLAEAGSARFMDSSFEWEKTYFYRVTVVSAVARPGTEMQVEGDDSPAVRVVAHDIFPPAVPSGLQAVYSGGGQKPFVDLIWAPVTNADLAGYNVYRREADSPAVKLNPELAKSPSYRDSAVASGHTYSYSVSAVDARGNESAQSEEGSETVP